MSELRNDPPIVHVYSQRYPCDAVEIFGTTPGLERLINALIDAVDTGRGLCEFLTSDGFETEARIVCLNGPRRAVEWRRSGSPYLDIEDPLVARIIELTEENARLRQTILTLRDSGVAGIGQDGHTGAA